MAAADPMVIGSQSALAVQPFRFYTSLVLQESTGLRAATLPTLLKFLRSVPDASIYYHTHYFLLQHHYLMPEPPNDFAYWVTEVLGEELLGERLAGIDTVAYPSLQGLRDALVGVIEEYLAAYPSARLRFVSPGQEFFFMKSIHVVMPTSYMASTLEEFSRALARVSLHCLYFHVFDARLRLGAPTNDFAVWIGEQLGLKDLAQEISQLDPYVHTLPTLRAMLLVLLSQYVTRQERAHA